MLEEACACPRMSVPLQISYHHLPRPATNATAITDHLPAPRPRSSPLPHLFHHHTTIEETEETQAGGAPPCQVKGGALQCHGEGGRARLHRLWRGEGEEGHVGLHCSWRAEGEGDREGGGTLGGGEKETGSAVGRRWRRGATAVREEGEDRDRERGREPRLREWRERERERSE